MSDSVWFDRAQRSVVAGCPLCGSREVFTSQDAADSWASDHASAAHPEKAARVTASMDRRHDRHAG